MKLLFREQGRQVLERNSVADFFGRFAVDGRDAQQGKILLAFFGRTNGSAHRVAGFQAE